MTQTVTYCFHEITLEVRQSSQVTGVDLGTVLGDLSWVRNDGCARPPTHSLAILPHEGRQTLPPVIRQRFAADGVRGLEHGEDVYLMDGTSLVRLQPMQGRAEARLAPSFVDRPPPLQRH